MPTLTQDGENGKWKITTLYHEYSENVAIPVTLYYPTHGENSVSYTISHTKNTEKQTDWATPVGEEIDTDKISFDSNTVLSADGTKKYKITGITWTQEAYRPPTPEPTYTYDVVLGNTGTTAFACNDGVYSPTDISLTATYNTYADGELVQSASTNVTNSATWSSNNTSVATVSRGKITPKGQGTANITAKYNGVTSAQFTVSVPQCDAPTPEPTITHDVINSITNMSADTCNDSVSITASYHTYVDGTLVQSATTDVTNSATWKSSNTTVATVNKGAVTYNNTGTSNTTVTITAGYNGYSGTTKIYVPKCEEEPVTKYKLYCSGSTPTGTTIKINYVQKSNYTGGTQEYGSFAEGTSIRWDASKTGYDSAWDELTMSNKDTYFSFTLAEQTGTICITGSSPTNATVVVTIGGTPTTVTYTGGTQCLNGSYPVGTQVTWKANKDGYIEQTGNFTVKKGQNNIAFDLSEQGTSYELVSAVLKYADYDFNANGRASTENEKSCDYTLTIIYKENDTQKTGTTSYSNLAMTASTTNGGTFSNTDFCVGAANRGTTLGDEQTVCEITKYSFTFMGSAFTSDMSSVGFDGGETKLTFTQEANQETTETEDRNCETKTENSQCVWTISPSTTGTTFTTGNTAFTVDIKSQKTYDEVQYCDKYVKLTSGEWVLKQEGVEKNRETKTTNVDPTFVNSSSANIGVVTGTPATNYTHRYVITSKKQGQNIDLGTVTFSHPECTDDTKTYTFKDNSIITEIVYPKIDTGTTGVGVHVEDEKSFGIRIPYVFDGTGATPGVTWMYEILNAKFRVKYKNNLGEENEVPDNWPNPIYVTGKTDEFGLGVTNVGLSDGVGESCDDCYQDGNWASQIINVSTESGGETTYLTVRLPDAFTLVTGGSENFPQLTSKKIIQPHKIPD